jgi:hypothetical protein
VLLILQLAAQAEDVFVTVTRVCRIDILVQRTTGVVFGCGPISEGDYLQVKVLKPEHNNRCVRATNTSANIGTRLQLA